MKWFFSIGVWLGIALLLYLLIRWFRIEANKLNKEKHKPEKMFKMRVLK